MMSTEWGYNKTVLLLAEKIRALALEEMHDGIDKYNSLDGGDSKAQLSSFVELKPPVQRRDSSYLCAVNMSDNMQNTPLMLNFKDYRLEIHGNASESPMRMVFKVLQDA